MVYDLYTVETVWYMYMPVLYTVGYLRQCVTVTHRMVMLQRAVLTGTDVTLTGTDFVRYHIACHTVLYMHIPYGYRRIFQIHRIVYTPYTILCLLFPI